MKRIIIAAVLHLMFISPAHAADVSKNAGICAAANMLMDREADLEQAWKTATNKQLAENAALAYMRRVKASGTDQGQHVMLGKEARAACEAIALPLR